MAESKKSLPEHLADFILHHHRGAQFARYRRQCLQYWQQEYGENIATQTRKIIEARWNSK